MTPPPAITIITPSFNRFNSLRRAIASVQAQDFSDFEHVIVDDASTDGTAAMVRSVGDPRIRLACLPEWQGANRARNAGIESARADLVTFLDSDDEFLPRRLTRTLRFFRETPSANLLVHSFQTRKEERVFDGANPCGHLGAELWESALFAHAVFIAGSGISVRKEILKRVGGFDPELLRMQDRDILLRMARVEGAHLDAEVDWIKHRSKDSISSPRSTYLTSLAILFEKHAELAGRERELAGYLVARTLLSDLLKADWKNLREGLRENRSLAAFQFPLWCLAGNYRAGKRRRKEIVRRINELTRMARN